MRANLPSLGGGIAVVLVAAAAANAATPVAPAPDAETNSTPTFQWALGPNEQASSFEVTPNPAPGSDGGFASDNEKVSASLANGQTAFTVGTRERLFAGTWYWHVSAYQLPDYVSSWTPPRTIRVRDERIRLRDFDFDYLSCIQVFQISVDYSDNSRRQTARWRVEFRKRQRGRRVASLTGGGEEGSVSASRRRPRKLRRGRYVARLVLRDSGGHVTRSRYRRVRISGC